MRCAWADLRWKANFWNSYAMRCSPSRPFSRTTTIRGSCRVGLGEARAMGGQEKVLATPHWQLTATVQGGWMDGKTTRCSGHFRVTQTRESGDERILEAASCSNQPRTPWGNRNDTAQFRPCCASCFVLRASSFVQRGDSDSGLKE